MTNTSIGRIIRGSASLGVLAAGLAAVSPATAQQAVPGSDPRCVIVNGVATCTGDLRDGVRYYAPSPLLTELRIEDLTFPIAPPGIFAIGLDRPNSDFRLIVQDGVIINTFENPAIANPSQGIITVASAGRDTYIDTGAIITVDGRGFDAVAIELALGGAGADATLINRGALNIATTARTANGIIVGATDATGAVQVTNSGAINASTTVGAVSGISLFGTAASGFTLSNSGAITTTTTGQQSAAMNIQSSTSPGTISVTNSGALTAVSGGTGERDFTTAGILVNGAAASAANITNTGPISITTGPNTFDTNFQGYAGGIVVNMTAPSSTTTVTNSGTITGTGPNTTALLGFANNTSTTAPSTISLTNSGAITIDQSFDANIIFAQSLQGNRVDIQLANSGDIAVTRARNLSATEIITFIQTANSALASTSSILNTGDFTASGDQQVLIRGLGLSGSGAAAKNATFDFAVDNQGDMTFTTGISQGITLFGTAGDTVTASITNSGNFDFRTTVAGLNAQGASEGIRATFGMVDPIETATGRSTLTIANSGNIALGAGTALIAQATTSTITNSGDLSTLADGAHAVVLTGSPAGAAGAPGTSLAFTTSGDISAAGAGADAIQVSGIADAGLTIAAGSTVSSGAGSAAAGLRIAGTTGTANVNIAGSLQSAAGTALAVATSNALALTLAGGGSISSTSGAAISSTAANTITLASGSSIVGGIILGDQNDVVTATSATIQGGLLTGAGNDRVTFSGLGISGAIDLGDGDDTLEISGLGNNFATILGGNGIDSARYTTNAGFTAMLPLDSITINGFEQFIQDGPGTLTVTGSNSFATAYELRGGTLVLASATPNVDLTTLAGTNLALGGTVRNLSVAGNLALSTGTPVTRTIGGNLVFNPGSVLAVNLTPAGADRIDAAGTVTLNGGTVNVAALAGSYVPGTNFVLVNGTGGVAGTFSGLSVASTAFLNLSLAYSANQVVLALAAAGGPVVPPVIPPVTPVPPVLNFAPFALTFNQRAASGPLPAFALTAGSDTAAVYSQLLFLQTAEVAPALDAISGEIHASLIASSLRLARTLTRSMSDRALAPIGSDGIGGFVTGLYADGGIYNDGNAASADYNRTGVVGGLDWTSAAGNLRVGISGGWSKGDVDVDRRASSADLDAWQLGAYARVGTFVEGFGLRASAAKAWGNADVERRISFGSLARTAVSSYDVDTTAIEGEARFGAAIGNGFALGPVVTIDYARVTREAFAESGAMSLDLIGAKDDYDRLAYGAGGFVGWRGLGGSVDFAVTYDHADEDATNVVLAYEGLPSAPFTVRSPSSGKDGVAVRLGAETALGGGWNLGASFRGRYTEGEDDNAGFLTISLR